MARASAGSQESGVGAQGPGWPPVRLRGSALAVVLVMVGVVVLFASVVGGPAQANEATRASSIELAPRPAERKAVRGSWAPEAFQSWEVRELDEFDRVTFSRAALARIRATSGGPDGVLPPGFTGRWQGTGDDEASDRPASGAGAPTGAGGADTTAPVSGPTAGITNPDLEMRWDPEVGKYVEYLTRDAKGREVMTGLLRRRARHEGPVLAALQEQGLPRDLLHVALAESALDARSQWNDGTAGPWRLSVEAARANNLEVGFWVDGRRDPELAATAAAKRLRDLQARFGSWPLALAAHRMGPDALAELITRLATNDYDELRDRRDGLPREALVFVARVLGTALVARNATAFGFTQATADAGPAFERVPSRPGTTLGTLARVAGVGVEALRLLNPELVRDRTPPDREAYPLRVPPGSGERVEREVSGALTPADQVITHYLRVGESLDDLAGRFGVSARELRRLNAVRDASEVRGGVTVLLPTQAGQRTRQAGRRDDNAPLLVAVPRREFTYPDRERVFYRVCDGDTLEELAAVFKVQVSDVVTWNNVDPVARLQAGMVLQLYVSADLDRSTLALLAPEAVRVVEIGSEEFHDMETALRGKTRLTYTARAGDTLNKIARRYGLAGPDLARINRISWNSELSAGQPVIVYSPRAGMREVSGRRPGVGVAAPKAAAAAIRATGSKGARTGVTLTPVRGGREPMAPKAAAAASRGRTGAR
jgi:membrane-bound lytic murein transglycosylase D